MAIVRPFRGLRPTPQLAHQVASPPYDVLSSDEARQVAALNPKSFLRVNKPELEFDASVDPYSEQVYQRGKDNLERFYREGTMIRDASPVFYLYRLTWQGRSQTGLVALASVAEYDQGLIKKHEHIRPVKMEDRANHIDYLQAQVGPVFVTYKQDEGVEAVFAKIVSNPPEVDFTADDEVRHELWVVNDESLIQALSDSFGKLPATYIADGHHRSAAASEISRRFREANPGAPQDDPHHYFLSVIFPDNELQILPYNRVIRELNHLSVDELLEKISEQWHVNQADRELSPSEVHEVGMYLAGQWYRLKAKPGSFDQSSATKSIDAAILGDNLIAPILGIENPKADKRISFVGGIRGNAELVKLVDSGDYAVAFSMYPTSIEQLLKVADAGEVMPPKSTWFEPKLRSGMVVNLLSE